MPPGALLRVSGAPKGSSRSSGSPRGGGTLRGLPRGPTRGARPISLGRGVVPIAYVQVPTVTVPPGALAFVLPGATPPAVLPGMLAPPGALPREGAPLEPLPGVMAPPGALPEAVAPSGALPGEVAPPEALQVGSGALRRPLREAVVPTEALPGAAALQRDISGMLAPPEALPRAGVPPWTLLGVIAPTGALPREVAHPGALPVAVVPRGALPGPQVPLGDLSDVVAPAGACQGVTSRPGARKGVMFPQGALPRGTDAPRGPPQGQRCPQGIFQKQWFSKVPVPSRAFPGVLQEEPPAKRPIALGSYSDSALGPLHLSYQVQRPSGSPRGVRRSQEPYQEGRPRALPGLWRPRGSARGGRSLRGPASDGASRGLKWAVALRRPLRRRRFQVLISAAGGLRGPDIGCRATRGLTEAVVPTEALLGQQPSNGHLWDVGAPRGPTRAGVPPWTLLG
ncbi:basic proline-rich protein-like [Homarus americanus]|uniref:basic proline-rich protein-like n=1 Tax=Homarus americanus TaxID=6706 RepID=UPI001C459F10|nr:basic proline-rich protein-like [Homarus americanus]